MQKLVGKLNFAQTAMTGWVGLVALRPLSDFVMRGGGNWTLEPGGHWTPGLRFRYTSRRDR